MFVKLEVLKLQPETQQRMVDVIPGIESVATILGELEFCLDKSEEYQDIESESNSKPRVSNRLSSLKHSANKSLWLCTSLVASALNTRATYSISPEGLGEATRLTLAILASAVFVFIADVLIARELSTRLTRRDALHERGFVIEHQNKKQGVIRQCFYEGVENGFRSVQGTHTQKNTISSMLTLGFLAFYFFIEFFSSLSQEVMMGDGVSWISFAAPSLGMLLNFGTGYFRGVTIEYPNARQDIARKYKKRGHSIDQEGQLEQKVALINHVAALHVADPNLSAKDLEQQKFERKFADAWREICKTHDAELSELKKTRRTEEKVLRQEMRKSPDERLDLQAEIDTQKQDFIQSMIDTLQHYRGSLEVLQQEMQACKYPLSVDGLEALIDSLIDREDDLIVQRKKLTEQQQKQTFSAKLKDLCNQFEADSTEAKERHRGKIKAMKQAVRAGTNSREESQLEMNQCEKEYLEDSINEIEMFQAELNILIEKMHEASYSTEGADSVYRGTERQRSSLDKKLESIRQNEIALDFNEHFEQIRDRFNDKLTEIQQQWQEAIHKIDAQKKVMIVDEDNERKIIAQINECNQKYQSEILKIFGDYILRLNQLKAQMETEGCLTDVIQKFIESVEIDCQYQEEKLNNFRESERFSGRHVA
jgi:hypothetical protein